MFKSIKFAFYKLGIFVTLLITLLVLQVEHISAQESVQKHNASIYYTFTDFNTLNYTASYTLQNNDTDALISKTQITLPYNSCSVSIATLGAKKINPEISKENGTCTITLPFRDSAIKPGGSSDIEVKGTVVNGFNTIGESTLALFASPFSSIDDAILSIVYREELGNPTLVSTNRYDKRIEEGSITISTKQAHALNLMWGNNYTIDIATNYSIENSEKNSKTILQALPLESSSQEVSYKQITEAERAYIDEAGNFLFAQSLNPEEREAVGFEARVIKKKNSTDFIDHDIVIKTTLPEFIKQATTNVDSDEEALYNAYQEIVNTYSNSYNHVPTNTINWDKNESQSSLDFSMMIAAVAQQLNLPHRIQYGYVLSADEQIDVYVPSAWVQVQLDKEIYTIDPYMHNKNQVEYFYKGSAFDRIVFGTFRDLDGNYNPALNLKDFDSKESLPTIVLTSLGDFAKPNTFLVEIPNDTVIYSGFYTTIPIIIRNEGSTITPLESVKINNIQATYKPFNPAAANMQPAVLPSQDSEILIEFRNTNFFKQGSAEVKFEIDFGEGIESFSDNEILEFKVDVKTIWGIIIFFNIVLFSITFGIVKILRKK